jgi:hypothetical protein
MWSITKKVLLSTFKERLWDEVGFGIVTGYGLDDRLSIPGRGKIFRLLHSIQTGSGATQPPIQWLPGVRSPDVERLEL